VFSLRLDSIATTENGWTTDDVCFNWFKKSFIPAAKAESARNDVDPSIPILVLFDSHGSHVTVEMIDLAMENNIILLCLPPHTTHLQPCDVGGFGPLKKHWIKRCEAILEQTGMSMSVKDVVREYLAARRAAFKSATIIQAWAKSGIDRDKDTGRLTTNFGHFTAGDFAPSLSFSTQLQMPEGFPQRPPEPPEVTSSESGSDDGDENNSSDEDGDGWWDVTSVFPKSNRAVAPSSTASASTSCVQPPSSLPQPAFTNIYDDSDEDDNGEPPSHLSTPEKFVFLQ
jgi:hypothetical protein